MGCVQSTPAQRVASDPPTPKRRFSASECVHANLKAEQQQADSCYKPASEAERLQALL